MKMLSKKNFYPIIRKLPLFNFLIAAILGTLLRYYIMRPFGGFNFLNWLQVHSHVMFLGWVTLALFYLVLERLEARIKNLLLFSIIVFQLCVLAMFISFPWEGYGVMSIILLSLTMVSGFIILWYVFQNSKGDHNTGWVFIRTAFVFMVISSMGPLALGPISVMGLKNTEWYNYAVYFYLHFQYNGWFFMALLGLFLVVYSAWEEKHRDKLRRSWLLLTVAVFLTFPLSVTGHDNSRWLNLAGGAGAALQLYVIIHLLMAYLGDKRKREGNDNFNGSLFIQLSVTALILKMFLQLISALPQLTDFIQSNRNLIIAYLHLVLIGFVSFGLLFFYLKGKLNKPAIIPIRISSINLLLGFILNETVLLLSLTGWISGFIPGLLFMASLIMVTGISGFLFLL